MCSFLNVLMPVAIVFILAKPISTKGSFEVLKLSRHELRASYSDLVTGVNVWITSTVETLSICTDEIQLLHADQTLGAFRLVTISGKTFMQYSENGDIVDFVVPENLLKIVDSGFRESDEELLQLLLHSLQMVDKEDHYNALQNAIISLHARPEVTVIKQLALTLGRDLGIAGDDYPSTLPFYLATLQLSKTKQSNDTWINPLLADDDCLDECPPCSDQECLGLCGYGCSCWKWICGDCCYHLGCYDHDICCRENFVQTKCLFPFKFKCEENYEC